MLGEMENGIAIVNRQAAAAADGAAQGTRVNLAAAAIERNRPGIVQAGGIVEYGTVGEGERGVCGPNTA